MEENPIAKIVLAKIQEQRREQRERARVERAAMKDAWLRERAKGDADPLMQFEGTVTATERAFIQWVRARDRGGRLARSGWPDFILVEGDEIFCVEVKRSRTDGLRQSQAQTFEVLGRAGLRIFVWSPDRPEMLILWTDWPVDKYGR